MPLARRSQPVVPRFLFRRFPTDPDGAAAAETPLGLLRRFRKDRSGATAVEFALIALPFFTMLFALMEGALVFWANLVLGSAVSDMSRELYTGRFQQTTSATPAADRFHSALCKRVGGMFDCAKIKVDVRSYPSFPSGVPSPVDPETGELKEDFGTFQPPRAAEIAVVQAAVAYPIFVPLLSYNQGKSGHRLLLSSAAFRAESF